MSHPPPLPQPRELGAVAAIEEVDDQAGEEPCEEGHPGHDFEAHHQDDAEEDAEDGEERAQRGAEAAMALRLAIAQDEHGDGDENKGEEGADVGEVGDGADVEQAGGDADDEAGNPCGHGGSAEAGMDAAEDGGQKAVAGHGEPDAGLSKLEDEDGGDHAEDGSDEDKEPDPLEAAGTGHEGEFFEGVDNGGGVAHDRLPGHDAAEHDGDRAVEDGAGQQSRQDTEGQVALRVFALFGCRRNRIEADVGEEDDGAAGEDAGPAVGHEGMPVVGLDEAGSGEDEDQDGGHLDEDHDVIGAGGLADTSHQQDGQQHDHHKCGNVEAVVPTGLV